MELVLIEWNGGVTACTPVFCEASDLDRKESLSFNEQVPAGGTIGVVVVSMRDVSEVDELQTSCFCYSTTSKKGFQGGCLDVGHLIVRVEPGEMHWCLLS